MKRSSKKALRRWQARRFWIISRQWFKPETSVRRWLEARP